MKRTAYRFFRIVIDRKFTFNDVSQRFGISFAQQVHTLYGKRASQHSGVLDDSIVNDDNLALSGWVRVCIFVCDATVGRPTGVCNANMAVDLVWQNGT